MSMLTYAVCTWNRRESLRRLLPRMRNLECPLPYEVLVVDNRSTDGTAELVEREQKSGSGAPLRYVYEAEQGIVHARNRAIEESLGSDFLLFIDDDELPHPGVLKAACQALGEEGADCVGGRVRVQFEQGQRPAWLTDELLGFLAEVDHGPEPLWIHDRGTPVWTANIGYRTRIFQGSWGLRFDERYNREGGDIGGGEDAAMFWSLLARGARIRYRPDMMVDHFVEKARLKRSYFLRLHFRAGIRKACNEGVIVGRQLFGVPPYLLLQAARHAGRSVMQVIRGLPALREAMNAAHAVGLMLGAHRRWRHHSGG